MIQDILPHVYRNEYILKKPQKDDIILLFQDNKVLLKKETQEMFHYEEIVELLKDQEAAYQFLFNIDETQFFYLKTEDFSAFDDAKSYPFHIFRTYEPRHLAFAGITAANLYQWYESHKFCGSCGSKMQPDSKERALKCEKCGKIIYPTISPAVIVGVIDHDRILLTKYSRGDYRKYALIAGFAEVGETLEDTVRREVMEEVGLKVKNIRYYKNQPWAFSGTLLVGFFVDLDGGDKVTLEEDELGEATWFTRENLPPTENDISLTAEMMETFRKDGSL